MRSCRRERTQLGGAHRPARPGANAAGVGHFFHGRLHELQECIREEWPAL